MKQGIGIVVSPTKGRTPIEIEGIKNIYFECTYHTRLILNDEGPPPFLPIFSMTLRQGVVCSYYDDE